MYLIWPATSSMAVKNDCPRSGNDECESYAVGSRVNLVSKLRIRWVGWFAIILGLQWLVAPAKAELPAADLNLKLAAPIKTWDEAVPLGNGLMGGLLWGHDNVLRLSLDRGDLWDERPAVPEGWWKTQTWSKLDDWDAPYNGVTPTKLPAGRLEITLDPSQTIQSFELNLATAEGYAHLADQKDIKAFFSATSPVALLRIPGAEPKPLNLIPSGAKKQAGDTGPSSGGAVAKLGYPPAEFGTNGHAQWYVQAAAGGLKYCVCLETRRLNTETLIAVSVTSTKDAPDVLSLARKRCSSALKEGYEAELKPHVKWWKDFWSQSAVQVPEPDIERQYYLVRYFYGAASRRGAPPMPLQGVWTADNGGLPPWKGDYHNDLNTQMTYIGYYAAGNFEEGASYLDFLYDLTPTFRAFAKNFYGTDGLAAPGVMSLAGQPLGGWGQYSLSPTMTAWSAHLFYLHWRYTMDKQFLRDRAYPWCREAGLCMQGLLKPDANGVLKLLRTSSPEIFDNSPRAWLIPNSNFDLECLKMLFLSLEEMANALGKSAEAKSWADTAAALGDFHVDGNNTLLLDEKTPLPGSHRHLSNIIALFPFNLITCDGDEQDQQRIHASLANWDQFGTGAWCGYTFSWMSCMRARVGDAETAIHDLDIFVHAFILRNGFHANGDQTKSGFSGFTYRPFTLEGNFLAMQAVHEMLLQSWSPTPGSNETEIIRIFPATPWRWHDATFTNLHAEGGWCVSARRENNATTWFKITATHNGLLRIRDNFAGRVPKWNRSEVLKVGDNFEIQMKAGGSLEAEFSRPDTVSPAPANVSEPIKIKASS